MVAGKPQDIENNSINTNKPIRRSTDGRPIISISDAYVNPRGDIVTGNDDTLMLRGAGVPVTLGGYNYLAIENLQFRDSDGGVTTAESNDNGIIPQILTSKLENQTTSSLRSNLKTLLFNPNRSPIHGTTVAPTEPFLTEFAGVLEYEILPTSTARQIIPVIGIIMDADTHQQKGQRIGVRQRRIRTMPVTRIDANQRMIISVPLEQFSFERQYDAESSGDNNIFVRMYNTFFDVSDTSLNTPKAIQDYIDNSKRGNIYTYDADDKLKPIANLKYNVTLRQGTITERQFSSSNAVSVPAKIGIKKYELTYGARPTTNVNLKIDLPETFSVARINLTHHFRPRTGYALRKKSSPSRVPTLKSYNSGGTEQTSDQPRTSLSGGTTISYDQIDVLNNIILHKTVSGNTTYLSMFVDTVTPQRTVRRTTTQNGDVESLGLATFSLDQTATFSVISDMSSIVPINTTSGNEEAGAVVETYSQAVITYDNNIFD